MSPRRTRLLSVNDAIEGILHAVRHQTNLQIHLGAAAVVLLLAAFLGLPRLEFMVIVLVVGLVLVTELVNSAIEESIDLIADHYHPLAKRVKDMAAGAVLVATTVAMVCGYVIFYNRIVGPLAEGIGLVKRAPAYIVLVALLVTIITVVAAKARLGKGTPMAGGMPSGHAAVAFGVFTAVAMSTESVLVIILTFILATMVSHSRLIYRVHTLREVVAGAMLGSILTLLMFRLFA